LEPDVELLKGLLERYSPTGQEQEAAGFLVEGMRRRGLRAHVDAAGNAVGEAGDSSAPVRIALVGHIDTVAGNLPVKFDGYRIHGRGAVDAKGPLCALVSAASLFVDSKDVRLTVAGAVAEEGDSHGALALASGPAPQFLVIGEPSGWDGVVIGYRGSMQLRVFSRSEKAHGSRAVPTPSEKVVGLWGSIEALSAPFKKESVFSSLDARLAEIRSEDDGLEESCRALFRFRTPPGFDSGLFIADMERAARGFSPSWTENVPAVLASLPNPLVGAFNASIREAGARPRHLKRSGTSDMNLLGPAWKCPAVAYGPGDSSLDHTPREVLDIGELRRAVSVLKGTVERLAATGAGLGR
jgi:LysW-gamma-L-lysine carboxypeptidase